MSSSDDIKNLFSRFGGRPERYRELEREHEARDSEARWPLLSAIGQRANPQVGMHLPEPAAPVMPDTGATPRAAGPRIDPQIASAAAPAQPAATSGIWPAAALPAMPAPAASAAEAPAVASAAPATEAPARRGFQFIPPRPRANLHPVPKGTPPEPVSALAREEATPGTAAPAAEAPLRAVLGMGNPAAPAVERAAGLFPARPASAGAPPPATAAEGDTALGSLFGRLSRSTPADEPKAQTPSFFARLVGR